MALTATFAANFSSLFRELEKAEVKFRDITVDADKVQASVQKIGERFSGQRMIDEAAKAAKAIESIGGAAILTDSEARRVNRQMSESYEKLSLVVQNLRKNNEQVDDSVLRQLESFKRLRDETDRTSGATQQASNVTGAFRESFMRLTAAFSLASIIERAVTAIASFATEAISAAGQLTDLRNKTGLSLDILQEFQVAAEQTGTSIDAFANASYALGIRLASQADTLEELGLSYENIKNLSPDEQFRLVAAALGDVENATERNRLGAELYGNKVYKEIAPAIAEGYDEITKAIQKANNAQIESIDRATDRYQQFKRDITTSFQSFIGNYLIEREEIGKLTAAQQAHYQALLRGGGDAGKFLRELAHERIANEERAKKAEETRVPATRDYVSELDKHLRKVKELSPEVVKQIEAARALGADEEELTRQFGLTGEALKLVKREHSETEKETRKHASAIESLRKQLSGDGAIEKLQILEAAFKSLTPEQQKNSRVLREVLTEYEKTRNEFGVTTPVLEKLFVANGTLVASYKQIHATLVELRPAIKSSSEDMTLFAERVLDGVKSLDDFKRAGGQLAPALQSMNVSLEVAADVEARAKASRESLDNLARGFEQLANIGGDSFKGLVQWMGQVLASSKLARDGGDAFKKSLEGIKNGGKEAVASMINLAASAMSIVGALDRATSSGNTLQRTLGGVNAGFEAGNAIFPGWGGAIGAVAGGLVGLVRGLTSVSEETKKVRGEIASFEESLRKNLTTTQASEAAGRNWAATTIAVRDAYVLTGRSAAEAEAIVKQLWDDKNPNAARAAIEKINAVMAEAKKIAEELDKELNGALSEAAQLGIDLPDSLSASIQSLVDMGKITGENAALFAALSDNSQNKFKAMEEAAKKYGVELSALGPAFAQNKITQQATDIISAFETMTKNGADVGGVIAGMSDEINQFIAQAVKSGKQVPENMRPILEAMIEQGKLTDENGNKLEDLSGINFGPPVESAFDKIIKKLEELINKISGGMGFPQATRDAQDFAAQATRAIQSIPTEVDVTFTGSREGSEREAYSGGTVSRGSWFRNFGAGTAAMLHGSEAVVRRDQAQAFAANVTGGEGSGTVDELRALRADMMALPQHLARAVRDAILVAG